MEEKNSTEEHSNNNNYLNIFQKSYQTINSNKILENIKESFNNQNYSLAKLYLFLMKLSNKSDYFGVKIQTVYYKSEIALKEKNIFESIRLGHKIINWINYLDIKKYNEEVITTLIQVLINSSEVCQDSHPLLSCWFLFVAKNIFMKYPNKNSFINNVIKTKFPFVIKKISSNLKYIKDDILDKKNTLIRLGEEVKNNLKNYDDNLENYLNELKSEKIYLINKKWVLNFISFTQKLSEENIDFDSLFQINPLCLIYFSQKDEEQEESNGIYCGEVNNFMLIKPKLFWPDNEQKYSNIFINKNIIGQFDKFVIFEEEIYNKIKFYMGINYEIERINNKQIKDINQNIDLFDFKIIFLNEEIRDKEKEHIIIKNMQINENDTLTDLINKIKRGFIGFLTENKYEISEYDYKIYLCYYIKQDIIDIILFYVNLLKKYKIKGELINSDKFLNENKNVLVKNIFNDEIQQFICCEVINKNSIVRPFLQKFDINKISCSTCNLTLNLKSDKKIYQCNFCSQSLYCSEKCKKNDSSHTEYHQKISRFFETTLKSSDIESINIQSFLDKNSRNGLTGLINIGGTDFLLSTIQALSSCEIFTKFILTQSHKYLNDKYLAKDNSSLISCYSELIYQMWVGTNKEINPSKFRDLFFNQIFKTSRSSNLDVLDILNILLDKFHNELNENKKKKDEDEINFYEQQIGESDGVAALRWWKSHKSLNDSIIIDLFHGQLKVKISCPKCNWNHISYPPFLHLNLPLPNKDEMTKSTFRVFPYSNNLFNYVEIPIYGVNKFTSILNIKNKITQYKMFSKSNIEAVLFENNELVEILPDKTLICDYVYPRYDFGDDYFIDYEIAFIEKPEDKTNKGNEISLYVTPIVFEEEKGWFYTTKNIVAITYCKYFSFDNNSTVKDLQKELFKYYRRGFDDKYKTDQDDNLDDSYYIEFYQKLSDEKYIEDEYNKFIQENNGFFDIYIYHNIPKNDGWIFSGTPCEFCGYSSSKKNCCKLNYDKNIKLKEIIQNLKTQRPLFLLIDFTKYEYMFKNFYHQFIDENDPHMCLTQDITIYDCFEIYSQEKKLTSEKNFICSKCSRNITPIQTIYPYSSPKYLILGIQRIKKKFEDLTEMINNTKDDRLVGYPLEGFDATSYFINDTILNKDNNNRKSIYNLKSVILHCGTIKKSSYKTIVKNNNNWYEIVDNEIKQINANEVINQNAYILIYEKIDSSNDIEDRDNNNNKIKEDNKINDNKNYDSDINIESDSNKNKEKKIYLKKEKKNMKKFKEEEDLLNDEELFGIKTYGEIEDI